MNQDLYFSFSCSNIQRLINIPNQQYVISFKEITINLSLIEAIFISEIAYKNYLKDKSLKLVLDIKIDDAIINIIKQLISGKLIKISKNLLPEFLQLGNSIGNQEIIKFCIDHSEININNFDIFYQFDQKKVLDFFLAHYKEISQNKLFSIDPHALSSIIGQLLNKETNQNIINDLFEIIMQVYANNPSNIVFESIDLSILPKNCIQKFIQIFDYKFMDKHVWDCIGKIILEDKQDKSQKHIEKPIIPVSNMKLNEFPNGIIKNMPLNEITVTSSSCLHKSMKPENVLNQNNRKTYFQSLNEPNQWILLSFAKRIHIESYQIKCMRDWGNCPMNWDLMVSEDNLNYKIVDSQRNNDIREKDYKIQLNEAADGRFVKIIQTGLNTHDENDFLIGSVEMFGGV
ncbi:hypothetical protein TVAG_354970 [Trichomonas vaginalis G3]|uniref:F5/8 type C domain-containing protein n=1 Tax=Trichomonas vaginalis (strain ATCC PRA-98 / G3) TaxID=412133 RepID=A2EFY2_TRIV3|nr:galactose-binding domain-like family [Trichomonas vaginalis G3]EAY08438.1 hypothetical protein TVAG_354970 [Trichomonas vaginalis G3]KAI5518130.1 galactose-binding domain-like family [Trichomonas vaginalis G3]|eukprot:XP_001320661.1 hypothetical protein [Trichomonas vaginalis G3]